MTSGIHGKIVKNIDLTIALVTQAMIEEVLGPVDGRRIIDSMLDARSITTESAPQPETVR